MQASQILEIVIVTLIFSDVVPQLKLNAFHVFSDTETSLLPYFTLLNHIVQFSRCCSNFFRSQIETLKALNASIRFQIVVEISGIEPLTSCLQGRRSPS